MSMRIQLNEAMKAAAKAQDKPRLSTIRMVNAAIKDRDIAGRPNGIDQISDSEIVDLLAKMVKSREESAKAFEDGGRPEMAANERAEIVVIREFMPEQMSAEAVAAAAGAVIAELGATGLKDMGRVMAALKERHAGSMDFGAAGAAIKAILSAPKA